MRTAVLILLATLAFSQTGSVAPPQNPRLTASPAITPQTHWVDAAWDPSDTPGVTYNIYRTAACVGCSCLQNPYSLVANVAGTVWTDHNVKKGKNYCYRLAATVNGQQSVYTAPAIAIVP